jgi:short-subunit dehydrogenase
MHERKEHRMNSSTKRPLAVVTGASSGIGLELAECCAIDGWDLVIVADQGDLDAAAELVRSYGVTVDAVRADLAQRAGVDLLMDAVGDRQVDALLANAGHGLGHAFLEQDFEDVLHVVNTNITGTLDLVHRLGRRMRTRGQGQILLTGSIAGVMPGSFQAVYNGSKAFIDSFSYALRNELRDSGVTVTLLMPGPTDTHFFERADMLDTKVGSDDSKADPADVARDGYEAMRKGRSHVVSGWKNRVQATLANVLPDAALAQKHRKMAQPRSAGE